MSKVYFYIPTKRQIVGKGMEPVSVYEFIKGETLVTPMDLNGLGDPTPIDEAIERDWVRVDLERPLPDIFVQNILDVNILCGRNAMRVNEDDGVIKDLLDLVAFEHALTYTWKSADFLDFVLKEYGEQVSGDVLNRKFIPLETSLPGSDIIYIDAIKTSKGLIPVAKMLADFREEVRYSTYVMLSGQSPSSLSKMSLV